MEYRQLSWKERGFESEQAEVDDMRDYVQSLMQNTEPPDLANSVLILANICQNRIVWTNHPGLKQWYTQLAEQLRAVLNTVCVGHNPKPSDKYENGYLYMPDVETMN